MAISKLILNDEVQMDVTSDTVTAENLLEGITATRNNGVKVTGNYPNVPVFNVDWDGETWETTVTCNKTYAECLTIYNTGDNYPYGNAAILKEFSDGEYHTTYGGSVFIDNNVLVYTFFTDGTHPFLELRYNSNGTINFIQPPSTYVTLTATAPGYFYPEQYSVYEAVIVDIPTKTSSDLTVSGATVTAPAGYYANAASKSVATTTHPNPTASITSSTGVVTASHTQTAGYVTAGTTTGTLSLTTQAGKTVTPTESTQTAVASYRWTTGNVNVAAISSTYVGTGVTTRSAADLTANGSVVTAPAGYYSTVATKTVAAGSAFPPAVTITKAPTFSMNSATGVVTASYTGSSSITPTVTSGYIAAGTAGTISTTGTSTYQLTSKAATTYYPSTADQTISSYRWLTGTQTIKSVVTSNLTAENIAEGVVVKVGDSSNASRITQITGTHKGGGGHDAVLLNDGIYDTRTPRYQNVEYNNISYYTNEDTFNFNEGDTISTLIYGTGGNSNVYLNNTLIGSGMTVSFSAPSYPLTVYFSYGDGIHFNKAYPSGTLSITSNGTYSVYGYSSADVNIPDSGVQLVHWVEV